MSLEVIYIIGYSIGACIHSFSITCNPINWYICHTEQSSDNQCCPDCCSNNYICSMVVSCGRGCYDGCIGNNTNLHSDRAVVNS